MHKITSALNGGHKSVTIISATKISY